MSHWVDNLAWAHPAYINIAPFNIPIFHNILEYSYTKMGNTVLNQTLCKSSNNNNNNQRHLTFYLARGTWLWLFLFKDNHLPPVLSHPRWNWGAPRVLHAWVQPRTPRTRSAQRGPACLSEVTAFSHEFVYLSLRWWSPITSCSSQPFPEPSEGRLINLKLLKVVLKVT